MEDGRPSVAHRDVRMMYEYFYRDGLAPSCVEGGLSPQGAPQGQALEIPQATVHLRACGAAVDAPRRHCCIEAQ